MTVWPARVRILVVSAGGEAWASAVSIPITNVDAECRGRSEVDWRVQICAVLRCRRERVKGALLSAAFEKSGMSSAGDTRNNGSRLVEFLHLKLPVSHLVSTSRDQSLVRSLSAPV